MNNTFKIYGIRGSLPAPNNENTVFGRNTSCFYFDVNGESIIIDAGTGIVPLGNWLMEQNKKKISLLISHVHLDHIQGLPFFPPIFSSEYEIHIYSQKRYSMDIRQQIQQMMTKPLWPVGTESFYAKVEYHTLAEKEIFFTAGGTRVYTMPSNHPDSSTVFRIEGENCKIVYALDYEHSSEGDNQLIDFAKGCDLLVYDAFYLPEDYFPKKGWGHSTWAEGVRVAEGCQAKKTVMAHINPFLPEKELMKANEEIKQANPTCSIGKEGEVIYL